jgi:hypothetical protein
MAATCCEGLRTAVPDFSEQRQANEPAAVTPSSSSFVKWLILKGIGDLFPHAERVLFRLYRRSIVRTHACGNRWRSLFAGDSMIETVQ